MELQKSLWRVSTAAALFWIVGVAPGCGHAANLAGPSRDADAGGIAATIPAVAAALEAQASGGPLSPTHLEQRGWACLQPLPDRIVCRPPNQSFPEVVLPPATPPADRPASFTFLVFDAAHRFVGTEVLLRTDLYKGQTCESTGAEWDFVPVIGYYECVHTVGRRTS